MRCSIQVTAIRMQRIKHAEFILERLRISDSR